MIWKYTIILKKRIEKLRIKAEAEEVLGNNK